MPIAVSKPLEWRKDSYFKVRRNFSIIQINFCCKNMYKHKLPFVSFIVPTFNSEKYLQKCLQSIVKQDYRVSRYEIFVVDGGSQDRTLKIAQAFGAKIINNPARDPETAKSLGIQKSRGEIIALMDSDNEIIKKDWLKKMVTPILLDPNLFGVESFYFPKKGESIFNTYAMILHIADPFSRALAGRLKEIKKKGYVEYTIPEGAAYPLGANGFLWNRNIIEKVGLYKPKFEESNFSYFVISKGYRRFARVPGYGIYHYHINSLRDFLEKRLKIGNKFLRRKEDGKRTWLEGVGKQKFVFSIIYCGTFLGPLLEGGYNFLKTRKRAWLLHPLMSFLSVVTYSYVFLERFVARFWREAQHT